MLPDALDRLSSAATVELLASLKQLDNGAGVLLIATHSLDPETPAGTAAACPFEQQFATAMDSPVVFRTARAITEVFAGYELVPRPAAHTWYPEGPSPARDDAQDLVASIEANTKSMT
ncbi:hypothetical protein AB0878_06035 [Amycolatopsis sp. NPDC047767]|uniref:hypothetical protein n=1 Tax=Amycolatopsis sp. NPDC047767 TaxID=3156765 RepID=UPI0034558466